MKPPTEAATLKEERSRRFLYNLALWILIAVTMFLAVDTLNGKYPEDQVCEELCADKGFPVGIFMRQDKETPERCLCREEMNPEKSKSTSKLRSETLPFPRP